MKLTDKFIREFFSYKRPHASDTEIQWIEKFIMPHLDNRAWADEFGNIHFDNRHDASHRTLFVSHTDTVHRDAGIQKVTVTKDNMVRVRYPEHTNCLGADDGAGTLVLLALIQANVPAYYIFTRAEEIGGQGAKHLVEYHAELLAQFDRAIAFDRKGTSSVISHQGWGRCCSDTFADAFSDALTDDVLMFAPDDTGVYTDTAEFVRLIPECTNVSVGYVREHTTDETLDLSHLRALIARVVQIDWEALPTERDPAVDDEADMLNMYKEWGNSGYFQNDIYDVDFTDYNSEVYDAFVNAMDGEVDALLYMMAEAINPMEPDDVYANIWDMPLPDRLISKYMRRVDYADDDAQTRRVLVDLYQDVVNENVFQ